jgi:hypothetical protein
MNDVLRWLNWTPSDKSSGAKTATKPPEPTKPAAESSSVSFDGARWPEFQKMDLPWPAYNGGKEFCCEQCGTRFDTSTGYAQHQVDGCG